MVTTRREAPERAPQPGGILKRILARPRDRDQQAGAPAPAEVPRAARVQLGPAVLGGVRDRGDDAGPRARRRRRPLATCCRSGSRSPCCSSSSITSYRQTVKAYPRGGGSYIVSKENLGTIPGLIAAAAHPDGLRPHGRGQRHGRDDRHHLGGARRWPSTGCSIAIAFVVLITLANLRGVEGGRHASSPSPRTGSSLMVYITLAVGLVQCLGGVPDGAPRRTCELRRRARRSACSSSCARSPPARRRSPVSRRSPTACRRSAVRRRGTPRRPSRSWGRSASAMFLGITFLATRARGTRQRGRARAVRARADRRHRVRRRIRSSTSSRCSRPGS